MMHRCCSSSSQGHVMGTCTCGAFHTQNNSFSMIYPMPNHKSSYGDYYDYEPSMYSSSSSSVDCTLSLGTPSTRLTEDEERRSTRHERRSHVSNSGWDSLQSQTKTSRGSNGNSNSDSLLARRCANCDTTSTPLWRNGPRGPKSLCNACGIRFKKEERRASAAAAAATTVAASDGIMETAQMYSHYNNSWYTASQSYVDDTDRNEENGIPFLSWTLNYT